ncbi:MAG: hypothetical protein Q9217_004759 [Psora testacea]
MNASLEDLDPARAHGTGTTVGDPLEAAAFAATIATRATSETPVFLGSAKSNFGHLEGVSGIVSVIKAAMMLEKHVILPSANFETPNPKIPSLGKTLEVPTCALDWPSRGMRRISVNNLGFGGSNAHVILEEAPQFVDQPESMTMSNGIHSRDTNGVLSTSENSDTSASRLYVLAANGETVVKSQIRDLKMYLEKRKGELTKNFMDNLAFTLGQRRSLLPWKVVFSALTAETLIKQLESPERVPIRTTRIPKLHLVTLGAPWSLQEELSKDITISLLQQAQISQPACTAVQLALVQLLESWRVRPHSVTGHSSGEIAAAYAAGALTFESCLSIAYYRGYFAAKLEDYVPKYKGAMLALGTSAEDAASMIKELKNGQVVVACINSPSSITASGDVSAIVELQTAAEQRKIFARRLDVDVAYHSPHMDLIAKEYRTAIGNVKPVSSKNVHFISSLMGRKTSTLALGSSYWVSNLKSPVQFSDSLLGCCSLDREGSTPENSVTHLVEIGPHSALKGPIRDILGAGPKTKYKIGYSSALARNENAVVSTLNQAHRMRPRPRNDILGTLAADSNDLEPRWRNIIRLDDIPWVCLPTVLNFALQIACQRMKAD